MLLSKSGNRLTAHFAYDEIEFLTVRLDEKKGRVQINFVFKDHKEKLKGIGFEELVYLKIKEIEIIQSPLSIFVLFLVSVNMADIRTGFRILCKHF